jgi:hypothetical protein
VLVVPVADVELGQPQSYDIQGTAMHPHTVTLTAADFATLRTGAAVTVTSSTDAAHTHQVTVTCT